jgi:hypothetical protein
MNKYYILIIMFALIAKRSYSATIIEKPKVDERVELMSIVFRLADCDEYTSRKNDHYVTRINNHFNQFKNHPLIDYIRKIRSHGIGYDAVMQMAIHIRDAPRFDPLVEFDRNTPEQRWGKKVSMKFLKLLREFYKDARCGEFFSSEHEYYGTVVEAFLPNYDKLDLNWYSEFYGTEPKEKFIIIIAPGNGGNNYGPSLTKENGEKEFYAIMGAWDFDSTGNCIFSTDEYFPILLHEFNHSFVNPLLSEYKDQLESSCSVLFNTVATEMKNQAYGDWEVMFNESVVRAAVIQYMIDHGFDSQIVENERNEQFYRGFIWINDLVLSLNKFSEKRIKYQAFRDYMPEIVLSFNYFKDKLPEYEKLYNEGRPKIESINEFENGSLSVDASMKTITINFNMEMRGYGYSINYGDLGKKHYPTINRIRYSDNNRSVILEVDLECDHKYELILLSKGFLSKQKVPIKDYKISFKTNKCT